jgi:hypothetical protein
MLKFSPKNGFFREQNDVKRKINNLWNILEYSSLGHEVFKIKQLSNTEILNLP